ncbi:MAG: spore coat U domain-containing protein [Candidatus Eremiobacteraeota bacterium]|nr:spore coat U domain-containing protein [Candidatus Eremiobacteraeota bacterium]
MRLRLAALATCLAAWACQAPAFGQACTFGAVVGVNFGIYNPLSAVAKKANGSLKYTCAGFVSGSDSVTVTLSTGNSLTYARYMLNGAVQLNYNLYTDNATTKIFGDGTTPGTFKYGPFTAPNGVVEDVPVFGLLPAKQNVTTGVYNDTITATINF